MKRVVAFVVLVAFMCVGFSQNPITKFTLEDLRKKGNNVYADVINREFHNTLKTYKVYKYYPKGVFLANDLSDTTNHLIGSDDTLKIFNNHVYHIYAPLRSHKVSIIFIPQQEYLYFFNGLNCCKPKHNLSDVLYWMHTQQTFNSIVFRRVENYNLYYSGISMDTPGSSCECSNQRVHPDRRHKKPHLIMIDHPKKGEHFPVL